MTKATTTRSTSENLSHLVTVLEQQQPQKRDLIVPGRQLLYNADGRMMITGAGGLVTDPRGSTVNDNCHQQIAEKLSIPTAYYRRMMAEYPDLLAQNINGWLGKTKAKYLLRRWDIDPEQPTIARALLSDRYNMLDNYDVLLAALEAIKKMGVRVEVTKGRSNR